jgi:hypothetical protein
MPITSDDREAQGRTLVLDALLATSVPELLDKDGDRTLRGSSPIISPSVGARFANFIQYLLNMFRRQSSSNPVEVA